MQRVKTATAVTSKPAYSADGTPGFFVKGDAVAAIPATVPGQDWYNMIQEELVHVLVAAGVVPDAEDDTQLAQAITALITSSAYTPAAATETVAGLTTLATLAEALAGAGDGAITPATMAAAILATRGKFLEWTTATRPAGTRGLFGLNTTLHCPEWWDSVNGIWVPFADPYGQFTIEVLLIGGGAAGGSQFAAGGGAAGVRYLSTPVSIGSSFSIIIGAGGAAYSAAGHYGTNNSGNDSTFSSLLTSLAGGGGANLDSTGAPGGSGGGSAGHNSATRNGGDGTPGQGYRGGNYVGGYYSGGGGGGAGGPGGDCVGSEGGNGGPPTTAYREWGLATSSGDVNGDFAGGGAGSNSTATPRTASGGGGYGQDTSRFGVAGSPNTGGGGGGGGANDYYNGTQGGSGICLIRYPGAQRMTGGTVYSSGGYTYHKITSSTVVTA